MKKNLKSLTILAVLVVICLIIITVSLREAQAFDRLRTGLSDFFAPVQEKTFSVFQPVIGFFASVREYTGLVEKLREAEEENARLQERYIENINLRVENNALRELIGLEIRQEYETIPAKVIGYSNNNWQSEIILNVGREKGVLEDMAVIDERGLVGIIVFSADESCRVRLLHDPSTNIGARVLSSRNTGIIIGSQEKKVFLDYYPDQEPIFKGDTIITSELSELVPGELLIGRVASISRAKDQAYRTIEVEPFVDFSSLEYVLVVKD